MVSHRVLGVSLSLPRVLQTPCISRSAPARQPEGRHRGTAVTRDVGVRRRFRCRAPNVDTTGTSNVESATAQVGAEPPVTTLRRRIARARIRRWGSVRPVNPDDRKRDISVQAQRALHEAYAAARACSDRPDATVPEDMGWAIAFGSAYAELQELAASLKDGEVRRLVNELGAMFDDWIEDPSSGFRSELQRTQSELRGRLDRYIG
jgi:hypothetical protein